VKVHHRDLAGGRWSSFPFLLQMAHVGSEVERALKWQELGNSNRFRPAYERMLELLDLSVSQARRPSQVRELTRVREALVDYFEGPNEMGSSAALWRKYFDAFTYAARKNC